MQIATKEQKSWVIYIEWTSGVTAKPETMEEKFRLLTEQKKLYKINNTLMEVFVSCRLTDEISDCKESMYVYVCVCMCIYC